MVAKIYWKSNSGELILLRTVSFNFVFLFDTQSFTKEELRKIVIKFD